MSDFPEKSADETNALGALVIGLACSALLWASVVALQAYFENTEGDFAAERAAMGRTDEVRSLKAAQRAAMSTSLFADAKAGTLTRLDIEVAKRLIIRDAQSGALLIPTLGPLNVVPKLKEKAAKGPAPVPVPGTAPAAGGNSGSAGNAGAPIPSAAANPLSQP